MLMRNNEFTSPDLKRNVFSKSKVVDASVTYLIINYSNFQKTLVQSCIYFLNFSIS